jgi:hypothetical protein
MVCGAELNGKRDGREEEKGRMAGLPEDEIVAILKPLVSIQLHSRKQHGQDAIHY